MSAPTVATNSSSKSKVDLRLDWCSHKAAKYACEKWHYSGSVMISKNVYIGVWEDGKFVGAVIFARGSTNSIGKPYGLKQDQVCELVRVALRQHRTPVTKILSIAIRMLARQSTGLCLIVSYADPNQNHHGGIYQGGNWIYTGQGSSSIAYVQDDGSLMHSREVSPSGYKKYFGEYRKVPKPSDFSKTIKLSGKHKYLYPLTPEMRAKIEALAKPYPKRASDKGKCPDQG